MKSDSTYWSNWFFLVMTIVAGAIVITPALRNHDNEEFESEEAYWKSCSYYWEHRSYNLRPIEWKRLQNENNEFYHSTRHVDE
jgi:hypothetical protein